MLGELLRYANAREKEELEKDLEKRLFPLWLANYAVAKMKGNETVEYGDFLNKVYDRTSDISPAPSKKKTAEEILAEFAPYI